MLITELLYIILYIPKQIAGRGTPLDVCGAPGPHPGPHPQLPEGSPGRRRHRRRNPFVEVGDCVPGRRQGQGGGQLGGVAALHRQGGMAEMTHGELVGVGGPGVGVDGPEGDRGGGLRGGCILI